MLIIILYFVGIMSGRGLARSRGRGRGRGRGGKETGRGGGNASGSSYGTLRDDDINDHLIEEHQEGFDSARVSDDVEISNVAPNVLESNASNSTPKKRVNFTPDLE